jgi:hypothetical protein
MTNIGYIKNEPLEFFHVFLMSLKPCEFSFISSAVYQIFLLVE